MIIRSGYLYTRVCLCTIVTCTDGVIMDICPCLLLVANLVIGHWPGLFHLWIHVCGYYVIMDIPYCQCSGLYDTTT